MSLIRVALTVVQAIFNQKACTPPNPTPAQGRYHTKEPYILQIAPAVFKVCMPQYFCRRSLLILPSNHQMHQWVLWVCALFEAVSYIIELFSFDIPSALDLKYFPIRLALESNIRVTPLFIIGVVAVVFGSCVRLECFRTLGNLFTFDLTVHPEHKLITHGPYNFVRHPSYTGSLFLVAGIAISQLTYGSWLTECGPLRATGSGTVFLLLWWAWTLSVGVSRAKAEDEQMRKLFGLEWDAYAARVPYWFMPGVY